jgi:hypothetical protein
MAIISIPTSIGGVSIPGSIVNGPLGSLFGNTQYARKDLAYPRDLGSATKGHFVQFIISRIQPVGYTGTNNYSLSDAFNGVTSTISNATNNASSAFGGASGITGLNSESFKNLSVDNIMKGGSAAMGQLSKDLELAAPKTQFYKSISLYMPDTASFTYDANYSEVNMTDIIKDTVGALPVVGKTLAGAVDSDITKFVTQKSLGLAINPKQQVMFEGIPLRTYQMQFTFTPYSQQEADTVKQIIDLFKQESRPQLVTSAGGMLYVPPSVFKPVFMFNGGVNTKIGAYGNSVIESVDVNYAPNGWATHKDGTPVQTVVSISFKELDLVDKNALTSLENIK